MTHLVVLNFKWQVLSAWHWLRKSNMAVRVKETERERERESESESEREGGIEREG